ncbi:NAD(P)/FAD-dependent oxidoreductase [Glycomyces tenuis]|uniref:NAD(P)/FAD-dependent oxidoreductase n=1 Tax=Glycomyces tenuis TaxID=58116 RepID=UPI0003F97296|nr:FAD-dependent oxidoreductase [Glycomyces tenuis]
MSETCKVVVVGGGYAGAMAANRLTQRDDVAVTLVNPRPHFVERLRLHQLVGGSHKAVVDFQEILSPKVRLVVDTVERIDAAGRRVALKEGGALGYDYLIYAVGSGSADPSVPGAAEFSYPIASLEEAQLLRSAMDELPRAAAVVVVGGGPTGIEVASELAEQGRAVTMVCGGVLGPYLHPQGRRTVAKKLAALGVTVREGGDTRVTEVMSDAVRLAGGRELPSALTIWTTGFGVPKLAMESGLRTDALGRLLTDETLTSVDDDRILAAGDSAAPSGMPLRMSCQAAARVGAHAADTVLNRLAGARPGPLDVGFFGQCLSLGRRDGVFQFASKDDNAIRWHLRGSFAAKVKETTCQKSVEHMAQEGRKPGSMTWRRDDERQQRLRDASHAGKQAA